ncbi:MAG: hypothetical protein PHI87_05720 [Candidatus Methanomethylophilus sp.]|nr:hypothetical protein [Methanomethylophilus sp.]
MKVTKYYCDKCKEEVNVWEGDNVINRLYTIAIPKIGIYYGYEHVLFESMCVCETCKEKYSQLISEMRDKWFLDKEFMKREMDNKYTININITNTTK